MKKRLNRNPTKLKKLYFRKGKNIISKNHSVVSKKYNIHHVIKLLHQDFKLIKKNMNRFTHFNIQNTKHISGRNYLIIRIYKRGYFDGKTFKQAIFTTIILFLQNVFLYKTILIILILKRKILNTVLAT